MTEGQVRGVIRKVIRQELAQILLGSTTANKDQFYSSVQRFDETPIDNNRKILPFGISSRAPVGTQGLVVPVNGDPTHLVVVGDFDANRPTLNDGESMLYDQFGHVVYCSESKIQIGTKAAAENFVLGQVFKTFANNLLQAIAEHTHIGNLGYETSPPDNAEAFVELQASPINDEEILSDQIFGVK